MQLEPRCRAGKQPATYPTQRGAERHTCDRTASNKPISAPTTPRAAPSPSSWPAKPRPGCPATEGHGEPGARHAKRIVPNSNEDSSSGARRGRARPRSPERARARRRRWLGLGIAELSVGRQIDEQPSLGVGKGNPGARASRRYDPACRSRLSRHRARRDVDNRQPCCATPGRFRSSTEAARGHSDARQHGGRRQAGLRHGSSARQERILIEQRVQIRRYRVPAPIPGKPRPHHQALRNRSASKECRAGSEEPSAPVPESSHAVRIPELAFDAVRHQSGIKGFRQIRSAVCAAHLQIGTTVALRTACRSHWRPSD